MLSAYDGATFSHCVFRASAARDFKGDFWCVRLLRLSLRYACSLLAHHRQELPIPGRKVPAI
jgi:hypothetical protein